MDDEINDATMDREAREIAGEIMGWLRDNIITDIDDAAHEAADSHRWVIYTRYALCLCANCDTRDGEEFAAECGGPTTDIGDLASRVAYGEILARIRRALDDLRSEEEV